MSGIIWRISFLSKISTKTVKRIKRFYEESDESAEESEDDYNRDKIEKTETTATSSQMVLRLAATPETSTTGKETVVKCQEVVKKKYKKKK